jgi:enamine deaminase RidA (YjgF/YER057c/UK114 family)
MIIRTNPDGVCPPSAAYSHLVEVPAGSTLFYLSGQVPVRPDGTIPEAIDEQMAQCWTNILTVLRARGMGAQHIIKTTAFLTSKEYLSSYREVRDRLLGTEAPASTLLVVAGLARPQFKVEIEAIAAA